MFELTMEEKYVAFKKNIYVYTSAIKIMKKVTYRTKGK